MEQTTEYTNPRREAVIEGWPWGQKLRTTARFYVEANKRGERVGRILKDPRSGRDCAPKFTTYSKRAVIVDGNDGRTYIATLGEFNFSIHVWAGDMQHTHEYVPSGNTGTPAYERHAKILALFDAPAPLAAANAEGRDITLSEGLDFLRGEGVQVVILDNPDTVKEQLDAAFGAPAREGARVKGTSGEGASA